MSDPVQNPDPEQQRHDNRESRRQSGLEPRPEDLEDREDEGRGRDAGEPGDDPETDP